MVKHNEITNLTPDLKLQFAASVRADQTCTHWESSGIHFSVE